MSKPEEPLEPDWPLHPGVILAAVLAERGIRQTELAERTGLSPKHVNQIVRQAIGVSGDVAVLLQRVLGQPSARFWTRADADYQTTLSAQRASGQLGDYHAWLSGFDAKTLLRRDIVAHGDSRDRRVEKVLEFFGVASPEAFADTSAQTLVSFRRSQAFSVAEQNTALWMRLVERQAAGARDGQRADSSWKETDGIAGNAGKLSLRLLRRVGRMLPDYTRLGVVDGITAARDALDEAGVALCFVRQVPGTRVSGAAWWPRGQRPVIGLTERHRRADQLWFTLAHELAHLVLHPRRATFLDLEREKNSPLDAAEEEADAFAEDLLVPTLARAQIKAATSRRELVGISLQYGMAVSVVAGQHGHHTSDWRTGAGLRVSLTDTDIDRLEAL